jgi:hypothetical protein
VFKASDAVIRDFKKGKTTGESWNSFNKSLSDIVDYKNLVIRKRKLEKIKEKIK